MTSHLPPSAAVWLLEYFLPENDPLIGDLIEGFIEHTRVWFWWQTAVAIALAAGSREQSAEIRPLRLVDIPPVEAIERSRRAILTFPPINLSGSPSAGVGGLGVAAIMLWLTREAPDVWLLLLISVVMGVLLSVPLVLRNRAKKPVVRAILMSVVTLAVLVAGNVTLGAQREEFDAASVKPNRSDAARGGLLQPGHFSQTSATLRQLITSAYGMDQLVGGPSWVGTDRFDVDARGGFALSGYLPGPDGSPPRVYVMLQRLIEDRFKLETHREMQERPVYALVLARGDGQLGPRLKKSSTDCDAQLAATVQAGRIPEARTPGAAPACSVAIRPGTLHTDSVTAGRLATVLTGPAGRKVIDRTGLAGVFNVDLEWAPELTAAGSPDAGGVGPDSRVSLVTALQEQLGLKLESTTAPTEVLVIDRVERPSPD